jgi:hypothetical protein
MQNPHCLLHVQFERDCLERMGCGWADVRWAMSVLHSRCFIVAHPTTVAAVHLTVPGIDMANHSFQPSATVRSGHRILVSEARGTG